MNNKNEYIRIPSEQVIVAKKWINTEDGKILKEVLFVEVPHEKGGETFYTYVEPDYKLENGDVLVLI